MGVTQFCAGTDGDAGGCAGQGNVGGRLAQGDAGLPPVVQVVL